MIAQIKGKLIFTSSSYAIIDTHGIGYQVFIPLSSYYPLCEQKEEIVLLHIYTHVREDALTLFGFLTQNEKAMFECMITVSSIGPKLAINILSGIGVDELICAITDNDIGRLQSIPGIGKKTAERMILELKDKIAKKFPLSESLDIHPVTQKTNPLYLDSLSALINLGYNKSSIDKVLNKIFKEDKDGTLTFKEIIKKTLQDMSHGR